MLNGLEPIDEEAEEFTIADFSALPRHQEEEKLDVKDKVYRPSGKKRLGFLADELGDSLTGSSPSKY